MRGERRDVPPALVEIAACLLPRHHRGTAAAPPNRRSVDCWPRAPSVASSTSRYRTSPAGSAASPAVGVPCSLGSGSDAAAGSCPRSESSPTLGSSTGLAAKGSVPLCPPVTVHPIRRTGAKTTLDRCLLVRRRIVAVGRPAIHKPNAVIRSKIGIDSIQQCRCMRCF